MSFSTLVADTVAATLKRSIKFQMDELIEHLVLTLPPLQGVSAEDKGTTIRTIVESYTGTGRKIGSKKITNKIPTEEIVIVLNYGPKSHAMFGEKTKEIKDKFREFNEAQTKYKPLKFAPGLAFGPGWLITAKDDLDAIENLLNEADAPYRMVERKDYEKEVTSNSTTV